jgi:hypothetical protein
MSTRTRPHVRLWAIALAVALAGACSPASAVPTSPSGSAAVSPATPVTAEATSTAPARPATHVPTPVASSPPAQAALASAVPCPDPGVDISPGEAVSLDAACNGLEVHVTGWWTTVSELDGEAASLFSALVRERLPGTRASHRAGTWAPLEFYEMSGDIDLDRLLGTWVTALVRIEEDTMCRWVFARGGEWDPEPPAWTCPRHLQVLSASAVKPPAAQLEACPDIDRPIAVERFVQTPRACFGTRRVQLRGWFDTAYVISGWVDPWTPVPAWLWSQPMGRVPMLSPTSDPSGPGALVLRIRPGSAVEHALRNRWVIATGHYARSSDTETCRARSLVDGTARPPGAPTRAEAKAACAREFILVSLRNSSPG